jgi:hypothetical protein
VSTVEHVHLVMLRCGRCGGEHLHELTYAGRLLASSVCDNCGHVVARSLPDLRWAYVADVEHRVLTKPMRMMRRVVAHPLAFARDLPASVLAKPAKIKDEWRVLRHAPAPPGGH